MSTLTVDGIRHSLEDVLVLFSLDEDSTQLSINNTKLRDLMRDIFDFSIRNVKQIEEYTSRELTGKI